MFFKDEVVDDTYVVKTGSSFIEVKGYENMRALVKKLEELGPVKVFRPNEH